MREFEILRIAWRLHNFVVVVWVHRLLDAATIFVYLSHFVVLVWMVVSRKSQGDSALGVLRPFIWVRNVVDSYRFHCGEMHVHGYDGSE